MKVLIVEDSSTMRRIIANVLKDLEFQEGDIETAEDGLDAWRKISYSKFDVILTDWNMPNMSGYELTQKVRTQKNPNTNAPIIMITTEAAKTEVIAALKVGVSNYIIKPFSAETLKLKLKEVMKRLEFVL
jgi:two-component system chemotaxis response regulator CheY